MKTILVPTDFSKNADNALKFAIGLAKEEKDKILLLNAWEIGYPATEIPITGEIIAQQLLSAETNSKKRLDSIILKLRESDVKCDRISVEGQVVDAVLNAIEKYRVNLVIMGTKGASGLKEIFIGSNTAKVIQKTNCPLIAVPKGAVFNSLKRITFATNYKTEDIKALKKVVKIAKLFKADITLLHVADENYKKEESEILLKTFTDKVTKKLQFSQLTYKLIYGKNIEKKLDDYVKQKHADLFVMSTLHPNLFDRLFGGSLVKTMAYHTKMPLMVFHHPDNSIIFL
ncbi:MAG: universal stress protein [Bacteroidota bacterium]|nr:universal stress protein [Bacteroidota bacterium]